MEYEELTERIIGCAYTVFNRLGFGFLESVYEKSLMIELRKAGLKAISQSPIYVFYEEEIVGEFFADILVEDSIVIELKSVQKIVQAHEVQTVNYLAATNLHIGLIINFSETGVEIKRKFRVYKSNPVNPVNPVKK